MDNLYVVDGSFFPSSGAVNPALTIMANALRVGDRILERLGARRGQAASGQTAADPVMTARRLGLGSRRAPRCWRGSSLRGPIAAAVGRPRRDPAAGAAD